ncbi:MAG TPA: glycine cleavage system aminomethyltransferase GcvT [Candidatus Dormibacteraeota bacterium]|jgi:aminomethyltransferase|nr:glycine cleavage system aminomethyltransferase GcvT [Candidatus Dormibacteraeota bacterium]
MAERTPLHGRHLQAGARMTEFAGWEMPLQYTSVREEQRAVRTGAGLFDVSHMGRFEVLGSDAGAFLQHLVTNDLSRLAPGRAQYDLSCRPDAGIVDDLVVYRLERTWLVVGNAGNRGKDLEWMRAHAPAGVEIVDRTHELGLIALQGPSAPGLLPAAEMGPGSLPRFGVGRTTVAGVEVLASRTGYTGEDGFELFVTADRAEQVWDALVEAGARPCGLAARDVCRLEAGLRLYGNDMDETTNPYEVGLGWVVKLDKGPFLGREALRRIREQGPARTLIGLAGGRTIPRPGAVVRRGGRPIGSVTSGTYSFWLGMGIGMALVETGTAPAGARVELDLSGRGGPAEVVPLPLYRGTAASGTRRGADPGRTPLGRCPGITAEEDDTRGGALLHRDP